MSIDDRIAVGDCEAFYDAVVEAIEGLEVVRATVGDSLVGDAEVMARLSELRRSRQMNGDPKPRRRRRTKQETACTDAGGKERQRSREERSGPASHGR